MSSNVSFRIPRVKEPRDASEANLTQWQQDLTRAINMLVDSVNSVGSYIS
jgi:hypothetical protein